LADYAMMLPEIVLVVFALSIPALDKLVHDKRILAYTSLFALILSGIFLLRMLLPDWIPFLPDITKEGTLFGLYEIDKFALVFKAIFLAIAFIVILGSPDYLKRIRNQGEYYALILLSTTGMMFVASAADLIFMFIGIELASVSTWALAGFKKDDAKAVEAAAKYFLIGALSSAIALFGISLLYGIAGTTNFDEMQVALFAADAQEYRTTLYLAVVLIIAGFGFKIALVPFHMWAPDVYEGAPTTVTAFLAAGSKKMGFVALFKVFLLGLIAVKADWELMVAILAIITMCVGNFIAISQTDIKRMLAYSSIAQAGYILIALSVGTQSAVAGGMFHMMTHLFMKGGAFMVVSALATVGVGTLITDYRGLYKRAPLIALAMAVFLFSLAGIPPLAGFASKWFLFSSAVDWSVSDTFNPQYQYLGISLAVAGVLNSALSLYYYTMVVRQMFVMEDVKEKRIRVGNGILLAILLCMAATIIMGIYAGPFIEICKEAAGSLLG